MKNMSDDTKKVGSIGIKSFISATIVIFALMVVTYILTFVIPSGEYGRITDENGFIIIDVESGFNYTEGGIPFWKWLLSPFLVLGAEGSFSIIAVIIFLLIIGGTFAVLEKCGLIKYMLQRLLASRLGKSKYALMAVIILFFMLLGAMVGSFEECVPLVPIVVALAIGLGWDVLTGMFMSILAVGCGFASGVCNPFTVGVAQQLSGLPMFSGIWLRAISFILIYFLLFAFVFRYAKKTEKRADTGLFEKQIVKDKKSDRSSLLFLVILAMGIFAVIASGFIPAIQSFTMIIVAAMFLIIGIVCPFVAGIELKEYMRSFGKGVLGVLPAVLMILMASSVRYVMQEAKILDTILHAALNIADGLPKWTIVLFIYLVVLIMNFFIPSGSAKAFLLIPLILPVSQLFGISMQLCILAFAFGDGFSNVFYPTNPVLLISLGISGVSYGRWFKNVWKFQLVNLLLTSLILLFGFVVGY